MPIFIQSGEQLAESGEPVAQAGNSFDNITATLDVLEDSDSASASGLISAVTGTLDATEDSDTGIGAGSIGGISGPAVITEQNDTLFTLGIIGDVVGSVGVTENDDVATGRIVISDKRVNQVFMFLDMFKHLLPNAKAWRITANKQLRQFFDGLTIPLGVDIKAFFDNIWLDLFPGTTRELTAWEQQFGLPDTGLTEQERRDRLDGMWKSQGGQSPRYVQDTLQGHGFNVFIHEWWVPGSEAATGVKSQATPRNPLLVLSNESVVTYLAECGEALAECGEATASAGDRLVVQGYPLVNKISKTGRDFLTLSGEAFMESGESGALSGDYADFVDTPKIYVIPTDPAFWPYFLYIGGQTYGELAQVDPKRRDEFENLCLKICPAQHWLGIMVEYT